MSSFQDVIEEQLKIIEEGNEIITNEEFLILCKEAFSSSGSKKDVYRPPGEKWYSKHRELAGAGEQISAAVATIFTAGLYGVYRLATDKCRQNCMEIQGTRKQRCIAICNMNASKRVIDHINSRKGKLASIKDPEKRRKAKDTIDSEKDKWMERYDKYKDQVSSLGSMVTQMQTTMKTKKK